ncbi:MAG: hypothetical protein AAGL49_06500 [Pseudomonadota bacterium]
MTTILIICAIVLVPALFGAALQSVFRRDRAFIGGGVLGLALAYLFFGFGHFALTEGMVEMLPPFVPFRRELIWATGIWEIVIAVGLLIPGTRRWAGVASILTLLAFFPANVYAALNFTGLGGHATGPEYLLIRTPLQVFLIAWTWFFVLRRASAPA